MEHPNEEIYAISVDVFPYQVNETLMYCVLDPLSERQNIRWSPHNPICPLLTFPLSEYFVFVI